MPVDPTNFLISFAVATAAEAEPALSLGNELWIHQGVENAVTGAAYLVLRSYGGPTPGINPGGFEVARPQQRSIQGHAMGLDKSPAAAAAAHALANRFFETLYDATTQLTRNHWAIAANKIVNGQVVPAADGLGGWEVRLITIMQPPGQIGTDANGRVQVVFNFDVEFERKAL